MCSSKARLLSALQCRQPDCVPVVVGRNLLADNHFTRDPSYRTLVECVRAHADLMFKEHVGTVRYLDLYPRFNPRVCAEIEKGERETQKITLNTPKGPLHREVKSLPGCVAEVLKVTSRHFIKAEEDVDRYLSIPYEPDDIGIEQVRQTEDAIGDRGLAQVTFWDPLGAVYDQIDPETFAVWSILNKSLLKYFVDVMHERIYGEIRQFLEADVGEVFYINGPEFILPPNQSPDFFDEFIVPYDTKLIQLIHKYGKLVIVHAHGKVANFLERFRNMGVDALHPLEPPPGGDVNIAEAKNIYGKRICLIGNIQYAELTDGSPAEIETRVKRLISDAGGDGGLIVSPCCGLYESQLPENTSRNFLAMIESVRKHGNY